jgi:hypothetical protein
MRQGAEKAPAGGVFEFPENRLGFMAENRPAAVLPQINQAAALLPVFLGVEVKIPGPEYRGNTPQRGTAGPRRAGLSGVRGTVVYAHTLIVPYFGEGGALEGA